MGAASPAKATVRFGAFEVDLANGELRKQGARLKLQGQPFQVLAILLETPGEVVSKDTLRQRLWGEDTFVDFDHSLSIAINKIREALDDSAETPRFVETLPRRGYRFIYPIAAKPAHAGSGRRGAGWVAGFVVLSAFIAIGAAWLLRRTQHANKPISAIAVLPFDNLTADPTQEYFVDGMTDELITELARMGGVRVISRTSSMKYKHPKENLPQIARELGVDAVVEGAVARSGQRVRVTVQLIRADSDQHLWANAYERDLTNMLALQAEIASAVARELRVEFAQQIPPAATRRSVDQAAYGEYLKGRYAWNLRREPALLEAIDHFEQAIKLDPQFAAAYSGLADSYTALGYINSRSPEDTFVRARLAANKALELDPSLAEPHASLAYYELYYERNWDAAEKEFQRAIQLNPNYALAHDWYGVYLMARGRPDESLKQIQRAQELDPLSLAISTDIGFWLYYSGKYEEAKTSLRMTLEKDPGFPLAHLWLARAYEETGQYDDAIAEYKRVEKALPGWPVAIAGIGWVYGVAGHTSDARQALAELGQLSARRYVTPYAFALVHASLGEKDQAFAELEKGAREKTNWIVWTGLDPRWRVIRDDPRFPTLLRHIGL